MTSKNITFILPDLRAGGAQKIATELMQDWRGQGHKVTCITLDDGAQDFFQCPPDIERIALDCAEAATSPLHGIFSNITRILKLRKVIQRTGPDTVVSFIAPVNILTVLATRFLKMRLILSERNDPARQSFGPVWDFLRRQTYRRADLVTANSESAVETLSAYVPAGKLFFIPNQLQAPPAKAVKEIADKENVILIVGRLHPQKAHDVLLKAFADLYKRYGNWKLIIVGDGRLRDSLRSLAKTLNIENSVEWAGQVKDPYPYYARAKIFVLPSLHEGTPNALLEAMGCGVVPIVSNTAEGALRFVQDPQQIFETGNVHELSEKIEVLITDEEKLQQASDAAKRSVQSLEPEKIFQQWRKIL